MYRQGEVTRSDAARAVGAHSSGSHQSHGLQSLQQSVVTEDLRKGLGGAVDRWISARNALPGEDSGRFPSEIHRLVQLIAFEACDKSRTAEQPVESDASDASEGVCGKEVTTTRFRLAHPEMQKVPFVFEVTNHFFSGNVVGSEQQIRGLRWKVEFELIGFFLIALHTQALDRKLFTTHSL